MLLLRLGHCIDTIWQKQFYFLCLCGSFFFPRKRFYELIFTRIWPNLRQPIQLPDSGNIKVLPWILCASSRHWVNRTELLVRSVRIKIRPSRKPVRPPLFRDLTSDIARTHPSRGWPFAITTALHTQASIILSRDFICGQEYIFERLCSGAVNA